MRRYSFHSVKLDWYFVREACQQYTETSSGSTCKLVSIFRLADRFSEQPTDHTAQITQQLETGANFLGYSR